MDICAATGAKAASSASCPTPSSERKRMRMKNLPVSTSSNCEESVMLQPFCARKPEMAATIPRRLVQETVST